MVNWTEFSSELTATTENEELEVQIDDNNVEKKEFYRVVVEHD